jgi:hypothetical protein
MLVYFRYKKPGNADYIQSAYQCSNFVSKIKTSAISSVTLRGYNAEKCLFGWRFWTLVIPPRWLNSEDKIEFMQDFFITPNRSISLNGSDWRDVYLNSGDFPIEFLESSKYLQELTFALTSKAADTSTLAGEKLYGMNESDFYV